MSYNTHYILASHIAFFEQMLSSALVSFYPSKKGQRPHLPFRCPCLSPHPLVLHSWLAPLEKRLQVPDDSIGFKVQSGVCVLAKFDPSPTPLRFCFRASLFSLCLFLRMQKEKRSLGLTKKEKGPMSYFPTSVFIDLTSSIQNNKKRSQVRDWPIPGKRSRLQSVPVSSCVHTACSVFNADLTPPTTSGVPASILPQASAVPR